jgi:hypothetical protein
MNDGYLYGALGDGGYQATHRGTPRHVGQRTTPNFEKKEGDRFGLFQAAPYLPSVRLEELNYDHFVITAGSPCAVDSDGWAVPAGYRLVLDAGAGQGPQYKQADVIAGVKNANGELVVAEEFVVDGIIAKGASLGRCIGVASYDVFQNLNGDVHNPATYQRHNYNRQNGFSILTHYLLEFPIEPLKRSAASTVLTAAGAEVVLDLGHSTVLSHHVKVTINKDRVEDFTFNDGAGTAGVDQIGFATALNANDEVIVTYLFEEAFYQAPFAGMATWKGAAQADGLVTFDEDSKWKLFVKPTLTVGDTSQADESASIVAAIEKSADAHLNIVGIVTDVDVSFPKQILDQVKTAYDTRLYSEIINPETGEFTDGSGLDKMPGSATDGVPHAIQYAGGDVKTGVVTFKLKL